VAAAPPRPSRPREESPVSAVAGPSAPPLDELTFLKSVSDDEQKPASRRPSNPGQSSPTAAARAVEAPPAPAPAPSGAKTSAPGVAKTLKCGECGTLNRPTEWYCERCGAELAGI
jgi:hypothetical protein